MRFSILHLGVLALTSWLAAETIFAQPPAPPTPREQLVARVADYDVRNPKATIASQHKAQLLAMNFVKNSNNEGPANLDLEYFRTNIRKRQDIGGGATQAINSMGNAGPLIPAVIIATAMQEVEAAEKDENKILTAWDKKQAEILAAMNQGAPTAILFDDEAKLTWQRFLDQWLKDAIGKGSLRDGLQSAPYMLLKAMLEEVAGQIISAAAGPSGSSAMNQGVGSGASSGHPWHERRMNHIVHRHERRMARADYIRARR